MNTNDILTLAKAGFTVKNLARFVEAKLKAQK